MKTIFENWRKSLNEGDVIPIRPGVEDEGVHRVEAHCECHDCVFNKGYLCVAQKIELDFAQTEDNRWICECNTYEVASGD